MMDLFVYKLHHKLKGYFSFERVCTQEARRVLGSLAHLLRCKGQYLAQTCKLGWCELNRNNVCLVKQKPYPVLIWFSGCSSRLCGPMLTVISGWLAWILLEACQLKNSKQSRFKCVLDACSIVSGDALLACCKVSLVLQESRAFFS